VKKEVFNNRGQTMIIHNMLEKNGHGYINGNIKLVKIFPEKVTIYKKDGIVLVYQNSLINSKPSIGGENRPDFDCRASQ